MTSPGVVWRRVENSASAGGNRQDTVRRAPSLVGRRLVFRNNCTGDREEERKRSEDRGRRTLRDQKSGSGK